MIVLTIKMLNNNANNKNNQTKIIINYNPKYNRSNINNHQ